MVQSTKKLIKIIFAFSYFTVYLLQNKGKKVVLTLETIGDTCYALAFSQFLTEKFDFLYFISYKHRDLVRLSYPQLSHSSLYFYNKYISYAVSTVVSSEILSKYFVKKGVMVMYPFVFLQKQGWDNQDFITIIKKEYFPSAVKFSITYPQPPRIDVKAISNWNVKKKKIAICNPYSKSMKIDDLELWESIVDILKIKYEYIYTNVVGNQSAIKGTIPLRCRVVEFARILDEIPLLVSIRSGIIDYSINTSCQKFILYGDSMSNLMSNNMMYSIYNLSAWEKSNIFQCLKRDREDKLKELMSFIGMKNV